jgi:methyltransferase-like protein
VPAQGQELLAGVLLQCYLSQLAALHVHPPQFVLHLSERPSASALARLQAVSTNRVTNQRHRLVQLDELDRVVLRHLDGNRDQAALLDALVGLALDRQLAVQQDGQVLDDPGQLREALAAELPESLQRLARAAQLVG